MSKKVVLKLNGCLEQGFNVISSVSNSKNILNVTTAYLPANIELLQLVDLWRQIYRKIPENTRIDVKKVRVKTSYLSQINTCRRLAQELECHFKKWLESAEFQSVEKQLSLYLSPNETIRIFIDTSDNRLHKLPWHLWNFIDKNQQSEIAFSYSESAQITPKVKLKEKVQILAILGSSKGINIEADQKMLQALPNAEVTFLVEPSRQKINDELWKQGFKILFFAGHSESNANQGLIHINSQESLTIVELKYCLRQAIRNGLQLAIFNSCDGLDLAPELEKLHLPQLIVMREPVPDKIAHEFLKNFLDAFTRGEELHIAVREARERLHGMEDKFPCASWLPIIFQNPTVVPPTWEKLCNSKENKKFSCNRSGGRQLIALCLASMIVTST